MSERMAANGWERLATRPGGTVAGLATASEAGGLALVFAATPTGLFRSSDGGRSWAPTSQGPPPPFLEAVVVSPRFATDRTIFAGARDGLYRSQDRGETWQLVLVGSRVLGLAIGSASPATGVLFAGTETDGVLRSDDDGRSWTGANAGLLDLTVLALALSPRFDQDQTGFAATASGLYRTRNGGKSWRGVDLEAVGLESEDVAVQCLAVSPGFADDRLVLAGTEEHGLFRSDDGGARWELVPSLERQGVTAIAFSTRSSDQPSIAVATSQGVAVSRDDGQSWHTAAVDLGPVLSLQVVPSDVGESLLAGLPGQGVVRSDDGGTTWQASSDGLSARLLAGLAFSPGFATDQSIFAVGVDEGVIVSTDGGLTWRAGNNGLDGTTVLGLALSPAFARDRTLYAATDAGISRSRDGAATWQLVLPEAAPATTGALVVGPIRGDRPGPVLAAALGGKLHRSDDGGDTWRSLGNGFGGSEVISIALSPDFGRANRGQGDRGQEDRTIFAGATSGVAGGSPNLRLWRSTDDGKSWECWLEETGGDLLPLAVLPMSPGAGSILVGLGGRVLQPMPNARERRAGVRRPIWQSVELPEDATITALAAATGPAGHCLFAASSSGVYVSGDGGKTFSAWSEGLSPTSVVTLAVSPAYADDRLVYAIGLGGTIWRRRA